MRRLLLSLVLLVPATSAAQAPPVAQVEIGKLGGQYGSIEVVPLDEIVRHADQYQKRMVRTQGFFELGSAAEQYILHEGRDTALLLPVTAGSEVEVLLGRRIEVTGVVRTIRPKQYLMGVDLDKIEDPDLPVMPAPDSRLPKVTISFLTIFDATPLVHGKGDTAGSALQGLLDDPQARGRKVEVVGQFRGANLFGDLPELAVRDRDAFVLKDGDAAVWVIGKAASGKGFALDPRLEGDTRFWLEVEGRLEPCGEQTCLRARRIQMAARPAPASR
jgi:hypothetical protein